MRSVNDKIKVLHTIRQGKIGGGETHVLDLVSNLPEEYDCEVLAFTDGEMVRELKKRGILCHVIHTEKPFDVTVWSKVKKLMLIRDYQLIHAHGTRACSNSFWAARNLDIPILYTIHGWSFHQDQSSFVRNFREFSERFLVRRTRLNIAVSESNQKDGIERIGMPNSLVIRNGVNTEKFNPDKQYSLRRADLNLPEDKLIVGMLARMTTQKDPMTFIRAAAEVLKREDNVHFLIVGGGDLEDECKALVQKLNLGSHITFQPFRTDVPDILNLLDIYCLPSLWEGLPIGILEAMAMSKPIVATPVDGTAELITDGITGLTFPERDYRQMAAGLLDLIDDEEARKALGKRARSKIDEEFRVDDMALKVSKIYKQILRNELVAA